MKEAPTEKFLLIITKKGGIKRLEYEKFQKASKSGRNVIKMGQKVVEECSLHQTQHAEHKSILHSCFPPCPQALELRKQIKECNNCKKK